MIRIRLRKWNCGIDFNGEIIGETFIKDIPSSGYDFITHNGSLYFVQGIIFSEDSEKPLDIFVSKTKENYNP